MGISLTAGSAAMLLLIMAVLAAVPSVSVLAVVARAAGNGFLHGALTALGIVAGDLLFILLAVCGLVALVEALGDLFVLVKYAGAVYLAWLAVALWRARPATAETGSASGGNAASSFMIGLLITLGDHKAILFYLGFLPVFVDLSALSVLDTGLLLIIATLAVGGVKLAYAAAASRMGGVLAGRMPWRFNRIAACVLFLAGGMLAMRA